MIEVFKAILDHQDRGEACVLASTVGGEGSAPRKIQSHMLTNARNRVCGTVGGGAVEGGSMDWAKQLCKEKKSDLRIFELHEHAAHDIGMICGGKVQVHFQFIAPDDIRIRQVAAQACAALSEGRDAWLMINLTEHRLTLLDEDAADEEPILEELLKRPTASALRSSRNHMDFYIEQLSYRDRVYIFGGGHVAQALVPVLASVDFRCVVIEDREEFCQKALFPLADDVRLLDEGQWASHLSIGCSDGICIMTRGHRNDLVCQAFALQTQAGYIGVIGSRRKIASVNERLHDMGFDDEQIGRITTPIGMEIGAVTPAEIAVSIAAQMIAWRAERRGYRSKKSCMA